MMDFYLKYFFTGILLIWQLKAQSTSSSPVEYLSTFVLLRLVDTFFADNKYFHFEK